MQMTGYTKLFGSIVASTIWREPHTIRIVWITMLAMANKTGTVEASVPGLADLARVTLDECKEALEALMQPDEYSRTPGNEGRRIQPVDGGWLILNHAKYRAKMGADEKREYFRLKKQEQRQKSNPCPILSKTVKDIPSESPLSRHAEAQSQSQTDAEASTPRAPAAASPALSGFDEFWAAYPKRIGKANAEKAWRKLGCSKLAPQILVSVRNCKVSPDWTKEAGQFIPHPATWLNRRGWEDELLPRSNGGIRENIKPRIITHGTNP